MTRWGSIAALVIAFLPAASAADDFQKARDALELFYIHHNIYQPVRCRETEFSSTTFVLCSHPLMGPDQGALWAMIDASTLVPVNGKAIGQFRHYGPEMEAVDGSEVKVKPLGTVFDAIPDIPAILRQFE